MNLKSRKIKIDHPFVKDAWFYGGKKMSFHISFKRSEFSIPISKDGARLIVPFKMEQINFEVKP